MTAYLVDTEAGREVIIKLWPNTSVGTFRMPIATRKLAPATQADLNHFASTQTRDNTPTDWNIRMSREFGRIPEWRADTSDPLTFDWHGRKLTASGKQLATRKLVPSSLTDPSYVNVLSYSGGYRPLASYFPFPAMNNGVNPHPPPRNAQFFHDIYDMRSGDKIATVTGNTGSFVVDSVFKATRWVDDDLLAIPINTKPSLVLCQLPTTPGIQHEKH